MQNFNEMSFNDMEARYGAAAAFHVLVEMEKAERIPSLCLEGLDLETRFQNVKLAHDAVNDNRSYMLR